MALKKLTQSDIDAEEVEVKKLDIQGQLDALDIKSARSLRAIAAGTATEADKAYLANLETQAVTLRAELAAILRKTNRRIL